MWKRGDWEVGNGRIGKEIDIELYQTPIHNKRTTLLSKLEVNVASTTTNLDENLTPLKLDH